jgi:6-pyruvoyltetrahydropterin/6-carboxytetrahydropterin synthase
MNPKAWMDYMFDHTMIIAEDDPFIESFRLMGQAGAAQVRILPAVGAEKFAEYIYNKLQAFVSEETGGRVSVVRVEFLENGRNTAIYEG